MKQWLNRSARASNVVGRGGGGGWEDADDAPGDVKSITRDKGKTNARASSKTPEKAGRGGFKRRRAYDDLDEEYDRGKVSKHARRKAEGTRRVEEIRAEVRRRRREESVSISREAQARTVSRTG